MRNPLETIGDIFRDLTSHFKIFRRSPEYSIPSEEWEKILEVLPRLQKDPEDPDKEPLPQDELCRTFEELNDMVLRYVRSVRFFNPSDIKKADDQETFLLKHSDECQIVVDSPEGIDNILAASFMLNYVDSDIQIQFYLNTNLIVLKEMDQDPKCIYAGRLSRQLTPKECVEPIKNIEEYLLSLTQLIARMNQLSSLLKKGSSRDST